jgi:hypothetical protein
VDFMFAILSTIYIMEMLANLKKESGDVG